MKKLLLLPLMLLTLGINAQENILAQTEYADVLKDIYQIKTDSLDYKINRLGDEAIKYYLREYLALMNYACANISPNYDLYMKASDKALDAMANHAYSENLLSNLYIHRSLVEMSRGNFLTAGVQFWKAYRAFQKGEEKYPDYDGQLPLRGIYNILLSQIPSKWQRFAGFFGFGKGDLETGFRQIVEYRAKVKDVPGLCYEALIYSFANVYLSNEPELAHPLCTALGECDSPIILYAYILSLGRTQQGAEGSKILARLDDDVRERGERFNACDRFPLLIHQKAKYALRQLDAEKTIIYADEFGRKYKGKTCQSDVYLMKAYAYLLQGDRARAIEMARQCISMGADDDIDERTCDEALQIETTNVPLLRVRLLFEYGSFEEAHKELDAFTPTKDTEIEYHFRRARIYEKQLNYERAIKEYDQTITLAQNDLRFFGPYSAIYACQIAIKQEQFDRAIYYIDKAKELNNGEYQKEIEQRITLAKNSYEKKKK